MAMRSLGYMPNEVELEVIIQRLDMDGEASKQIGFYYFKSQKRRCFVLLLPTKLGFTAEKKKSAIMNTNCSSFLQVTARWILRSLLLFWVQSSQQLGYQTNSVALTLTQFFGRCSL